MDEEGSDATRRDAMSCCEAAGVRKWSRHFSLTRNITTQFYRLIAASFLNCGVLQLVTNILILYNVGRNLEQNEFGSPTTLKLLSLSMIISPLVSIVLQPDGVTTASGAFPLTLIGSGYTHHQLKLYHERCMGRDTDL